MSRYVMTARRRAALRKAQRASANKRRGRRGRKIAGVLGATLGVSAGAVAYRKSPIGFRHRSAWSEAKLVRSYVNTGTKYNGEYMSFGSTLKYARSLNRDFKVVDRRDRAFKKSVRKTIRSL